MATAAPDLSQDAWSHKYWSLIHSDKLDQYHSPQRFHLLKLLQMPPDGVGIRDGSAPRFNCAGRFIAAARLFEVPANALGGVLNQRSGAFHRYWRVGTTYGAGGESQWAVMRDGGFVSIGWRSVVPDLSGMIGQQEPIPIREQIREWLLPRHPDNPGMAT